MPTRRRSATAPPGSRRTASISPATRCPSRSTTSRPPAGRSATGRSTSSARAPARGSAMIYAWRYPRSIHRSVMIGVNPPGHFLWSPKTTDEQIRRYSRALRAGRELQQPHRRPRRLDAQDGSAHARTASWACRSTRNDARIATFYSADGVDLRVGAADGADDDRHLALRRERRRERALVPLAAGEDGVPGVVRLGRAGRGREGGHRRPPTRYFAQGPHRKRLDPRQRRHRVPLRRRRPDARVPAGSGRERVHARAGLGRRDAPRRRHARLRDAAEVRDPGAAAAPPQRPPGRALGARPRRLLLVVRAEGEHAAPERVLRQRQGRHLALHPGEGRLHARRDADGARQGLRRHDARPAGRSCSSRCC